MTATERFVRVLVAVGASAVLALSCWDGVALAAAEPELLLPGQPVWSGTLPTTA